ncbi:hypothetical protein JTE90_020855 [Oedothorax gibbosus]|uniref:Uncharacterized protein n=1 Tax=Oedothorax gibbosus TaxID=931172 RepID=A0AAV6UQH3_9ARAC|nr:hypothetical protein JTE90_020855 [Oedothorax gibbosus]
MDISEVTIFAEDLVMCLCRLTGIWWKPRSWLNKPRNVSHDKFTDRIGDVVYYLLLLHWRTQEACTPEVFPAGLESYNEYLFAEFFKYGYEAFNMLNYFAQLLSVGILYKGNYGQSDALDFCADAVEKAINHLAEAECIPLADIWNQLKQTAEKVDITYCQREPYFMWTYPS